MNNLVEPSSGAEPFLPNPESATATTGIPEPVLKSFQTFLDTVPAHRLNKGLRKLLVDYLFYNLQGLPTDFEELLGDFYWLTHFLDELHEAELQKVG